MKKKQLEQYVKELEQENIALKHLIGILHQDKADRYVYIYPGSPGYMPAIQPPPLDSGTTITDTTNYRIFI